MIYRAIRGKTLFTALAAALALSAPPAFAGKAMEKYELGNKLLSAGRPKSAIVFYDKCLKLNPSFYPAYIKRGDALAKIGQKSWAQADYKYALKINPRCGEARKKLNALSGKSSRKRSTAKKTTHSKISQKKLSGAGLSRASKSSKLAPPTSD